MAKPLKTRIEIEVVDADTDVGRHLAKVQGEAVRRALEWFASNPVPPPRLGYGQLAPLILTHLRNYPDKDFTPYDLAKVLGHSHGAIRRQLKRLVVDGAVAETSQRPARFQHREDHNGS